MPFDMWKLCNRIADRIDHISVIVGQTSSYLVLLSISLITISVVFRYFLNRTYVALDEIQYYCYSMVFLFGFSYIYREDGHIKVDIFYTKFSEKKKRFINLLGTLFLTIPWTAAISYYSFKYFLQSYAVSERSSQPTGLPALYTLKFVLFLAFALLFLQAVAKAIHVITTFQTKKPN